MHDQTTTTPIDTGRSEVASGLPDCINYNYIKGNNTQIKIN